MDIWKKFQDQFKKDFLKSFPNGTMDRLYDTTNGYKSINQVSDFIGYVKPNIFYLECKTHKGASIPFTNITQYDKLVQKSGINGVRAGVILWLYEKDEGVIYIPISTIREMKKDGEKSFGIRHLNSEKYKSYVLPGIKKRFYIDTDYSQLSNLNEGE